MHDLCSYLSSGPIVKYLKKRRLLKQIENYGSTNPKDAAEGTIRKNLVFHRNLQCMDLTALKMPE